MAKPETPAPPVNLAWRDVPVPKTQDELQEAISRGVARALELASTSPDIVKAVDSAVEWYKVLYASDEDEGQGSALKGGNGNGTGASG